MTLQDRARKLADDYTIGAQDDSLSKAIEQLAREFAAEALRIAYGDEADDENAKEWLRAAIEAAANGDHQQKGETK